MSQTLGSAAVVLGSPFSELAETMRVLRGGVPKPRAGCQGRATPSHRKGRRRASLSVPQSHRRVERAALRASVGGAVGWAMRTRMRHDAGCFSDS
jgi:hypothetical protein